MRKLPASVLSRVAFKVQVAQEVQRPDRFSHGAPGKAMCPRIKFQREKRGKCEKKSMQLTKSQFQRLICGFDNEIGTRYALVKGEGIIVLYQPLPLSANV